MTERPAGIEAVHRDASSDEVFAAEIRPHRSLGPRGVAIVLSCFAGLCAAISVPLYMFGAWPVIGFLGLDVLALWIAFRLSSAQARACEQVALSYLELLVRKISPRGSVREWRFNPVWVTLETETDADFGMTRVAIASRASRLDLAAALSPAERADFARSFGRALAAAKAGPRTTPDAPAT